MTPVLPTITFRPCPFCGHPPIHWEYGLFGGGRLLVKCERCDIYRSFATLDDALAWWNRRADD